MRQRVNTSPFIGDLDRWGLDHDVFSRDTSQQASAALIASAIAYERPRAVARLILAGEIAQSRRDVLALENTSRGLLELAEDDEQFWVAHYYRAVALNRRGPVAYPWANCILEKVAYLGPPIYRAKAHKALGAIKVLRGHRAVHNRSLCGHKCSFPTSIVFRVVGGFEPRVHLSDKARKEKIRHEDI
jgi:hypothetical protein